jgi:type II secretion system protein J
VSYRIALAGPHPNPPPEYRRRGFKPGVIGDAHRAHRTGFTLIELILAITISVVLAWTLYSAMYSALHARKSAEAAVEPTRAGAIAADLMRQDFDNVPPPTGILAGPFEGVHSAGQGGADSDDVQFYTVGTDEPADGSPLEDGIRKVELTISTDYNPPALVRRVTRNLLSSSEPLVNEEVLCRNVRGFSLTYFDGYTWQDSWDSTADNVLPLAVSMTLQLNDPTAADPQQAPPRTITRVFPLACGKISDDTSLGGM